MDIKLTLAILFILIIIIATFYKKYICLSYKQDLLLLDIEISNKYISMTGNESIKNKKAYFDFTMIIKNLQQAADEINLIAILFVEYCKKPEKIKKNALEIDQNILKIKDSEFVYDFEKLEDYTENFLIYKNPIIFIFMIIVQKIQKLTKRKITNFNKFNNFVKYQYHKKLLGMK